MYADLMIDYQVYMCTAFMIDLHVYMCKHIQTRAAKILYTE